MKFFSWMQDKLNGRQGSNNKTSKMPTPSQAKLEPREEFSDWPHGLLAIGTFGNNESKETKGTQSFHENPSSPEDFSKFTPEEVGKLQKELTKLLSRKPASKTEKEITDLPLDRFLNCPSSLDVDRRISNSLCSNSDDIEDDIDIERTISVILRKCKEISADSNSKKSISKKSISFLLKKMFVCASGFTPAPSLRDSLQESRMERLLRTMLHKKVYHRNSSRASSMKKYLEGKANLKAEKEEDRQGRDNDFKWVKTDSEYIVLEI